MSLYELKSTVIYYNIIRYFIIFNELLWREYYKILV